MTSYFDMSLFCLPRHFIDISALIFQEIIAEGRGAVCCWAFVSDKIDGGLLGCRFAGESAEEFLGGC